MVRKVKTASDYFNTLAVNAREPKLIKAIIDEDIKAMDGSRVRLRLLDAWRSTSAWSNEGRICMPP